MSMMYQKLADNQEIKQANLMLFSHLIKYETMTRSIYHRIEVERFEATKALQHVEDQMREILRNQGRNDNSIDLDAENQSIIASEDSKIISETDVPFDHHAWQQLQ